MFVKYSMWTRFGIVVQEGVITVHRKDLFCCTLYCRSQSPQVAVFLFFFFGPSSASLHREGGDFGGKFAFKLPRPKQSYYIHSHPETTHTLLQTVACRRACFIKKTIKFDEVGERPVTNYVQISLTDWKEYKNWIAPSYSPCSLSFPNGIPRTIWFSNQNLRFSHV